MSLATLPRDAPLRTAIASTVEKLRVAYGRDIRIFLFEHGPGFIEGAPIACGSCSESHVHLHFVVLPRSADLTFERALSLVEDKLGRSGWRDVQSRRIVTSEPGMGLSDLAGEFPYLHCGIISPDNTMQAATWPQRHRDEVVQSRLFQQLLTEKVFYNRDGIAWVADDRRDFSAAPGEPIPAAVRYYMMEMAMVRSAPGMGLGGDILAPASTPVFVINGLTGTRKMYLGRQLAQRLGWRYFDVGFLFSAIALAAQQAGVSVFDATAMGNFAATLRLDINTDPARGESTGVVGINGWWYTGRQLESVPAFSVCILPSIRVEVARRTRDLVAKGGPIVLATRDGDLVLRDLDPLVVNVQRDPTEVLRAGDADEVRLLQEQFLHLRRPINRIVKGNFPSLAPDERSHHLINTGGLDGHSHLREMLSICDRAGFTRKATYHIVPGPSVGVFDTMPAGTPIQLISGAIRAGYARRLASSPPSRSYGATLVATKLMMTVEDVISGASLPAGDPAVELLGRAYIQRGLWFGQAAPPHVGEPEGPPPIVAACVTAIQALIEFHQDHGTASAADASSKMAFIQGMEREIAESFSKELTDGAVARLVVELLTRDASLDHIGRVHAALMSVVAHTDLDRHVIVDTLYDRALSAGNRDAWLRFLQGWSAGTDANLPRLLAEMANPRMTSLGFEVGRAYFQPVPATGAGIAAAFNQVADALGWWDLGLESKSVAALYEGLQGPLSRALSECRLREDLADIGQEELRYRFNGSLSENVIVAAEQVLLIGAALDWAPAAQAWEMRLAARSGRPSAGNASPGRPRLDWSSPDDDVDHHPTSAWVNTVMTMATRLVSESIDGWRDCLDGGGLGAGDRSKIMAFITLAQLASGPDNRLLSPLAAGLVERARQVGGDLGVPVLTLADEVEAAAGPDIQSLREEILLLVASDIAEAVTGVALGAQSAIDEQPLGLVALALGKDPTLRRHSAVAVQQLLVARFGTVPEGATTRAAEDFAGEVMAALRSIDQRFEAAGLARTLRGDMLMPSLAWLQPALTEVFQEFEQGSQRGGMDPEVAVQILTLGRTAPGPIADMLLVRHRRESVPATVEMILDSAMRSGVDGDPALAEGALQVVRSVVGNGLPFHDAEGPYARLRERVRPGVPHHPPPLQALTGGRGISVGRLLGERLFDDFSGTAESLGLCLQRIEHAVDWGGLGSREGARDVLQGMSDALRNALRRNSSTIDFGSIEPTLLRSIFDSHLSHDLTTLARQVWIVVDAFNDPTRPSGGRWERLPGDVGDPVVKAVVRQATIGRVDEWWAALVSDNGLQDMEPFNWVWEAVPEEDYVLESVAPIGGALIERTEMVDGGDSLTALLALRQRFDSAFGRGGDIASDWLVRAVARRAADLLWLSVAPAGHGAPAHPRLEPAQLSALALTLSKDKDMRWLTGHEIQGAAEREFGRTPAGEPAVDELTRITAIDSALADAGMARVLRAEVLTAGLRRLGGFLDGDIPVRTGEGTIEFGPLIAGPILQAAVTCPHLLAPTVIRWAADDPDPAEVLEALWRAGSAGTAGPRVAALGVSHLIAAITDIQGLRSRRLNDLYARARAGEGAPEPSRTTPTAANIGQATAHNAISSPVLGM